MTDGVFWVEKPKKYLVLEPNLTNYLEIAEEINATEVTLITRIGRTTKPPQIIYSDQINYKIVVDLGRDVLLIPADNRKSVSFRDLLVISQLHLRTDYNPVNTTTNQAN